MYDIPGITNPELKEMDTNVQLWYACRVDQITFQCEWSRRRDSTRLNHLAYIETLQDRNANFSDAVRERDFQTLEEYAYIQFFCVHKFRGISNMLAYSIYRETQVVDGLVLDKRFKCRGFADVITLKYLCAKVTGKDGWIYFVDMSEKMVERICASLRI